MDKTISRERHSDKIVEKVALSQIILCVCAFMFARVGIEGQFYTLGIAYLATLHRNSSVRKWCGLFATLGYISIAIFNVNAINYIIIAGFITVFRSLMERARIQFNLKNQMVVVSAAMLIVKLSLLFITGFNIVTIGLVLLEIMVACMLMVFLDYGVGAILENKQYALTQKEATSVILMFVGILAGTVDFYITMPVFIEIYFRDVMVYVFLMAITYLGGVNLGVTVSVVLGGLLYAIGYIPLHFCLIYSAGSILAGILQPLGKTAVTLGMGLGNLIGFAVFNAGVLDMPLLGAFIIAAIINSLLSAKYFGFANWFKEKQREEQEKIHMMHIQDTVATRLDHFRKAFYKLGVSFQNEQFRRIELDRKKMESIVEETHAKLCSNCNFRKYCWEDKVEKMYTMSLEMVLIGQANGRIVKKDIPEEFSRICAQPESFASILNFRLDLSRQNVIYENQVIETKMLMGQQMVAVSDSINSITEEITEEVVFNKELEYEIQESLISIGIKVKDVLLLETEGELKLIELYTKHCNKNPNMLKAIIKTIEHVMHTKVEIKNHVCNPLGCYFQIIKKQKFSVLAGAAICAKGDISGDVHSFMQLDNGKYLMAVADGMGNGEAARQESKITIEMLEEFMEAGLDEEVALRLINSSLILRMENEVFSTIDVTIIDTSTGVAKLLKAGAATTFILRANDDEVVTIRSNSLPVGIIKDVDIETHHVQLEYGDTIVMVTDGLLATPEDALGREAMFKELILETTAKDPEQKAHYLLNKSRQLLSGDYSDDMTVIVGCVWKKMD
ncbi:MAG: hypothetical protein ATN33_07395 [Epulopiscium sp. Nele67-Bin001]|nr:MAG: hypothetical protein ATN33_07395 [Epulopiscium sp. Nele67-Bin001]